MSSTLSFDEIRNESNLKFTDISSELWRQYDYPQYNKNILIHDPIALNVSKAGGHRLIDGQGDSHYIPKGWVHLKWRAREGAAHFVT